MSEELDPIVYVDTDGHAHEPIAYVDADGCMHRPEDIVILYLPSQRVEEKGD